tara:strand:- start:46 stop:399 length:354 start_codon:yes stop_codon:yes gene_type:complete
MFKFQTTLNENYILLELSGRLMIYEDAQKIQNKVINELSDTKNIVVISFKDLEYLNSSGLSALITILTKSRNFGGETIITNIPDSIHDLLIISKLNTVFNIEQDLDSVLSSLNNVKN